MPNSIITSAGLALFARAFDEGLTISVDRMIFADIPELDPSVTPDPAQTLPAASQIVLDAAIETQGKIDADTVVYSKILAATDGDFYLNWIGLYSTQYTCLVAVCHVPRHKKIKTSGFEAGNTLYKNFAIQFANADALTGITIAPESWQYDFDDRYALKNHNHDTTYEPLGSVSTHNQAAAAHKTLFDQKAPLASPAFTGTPTVPTAAAGTNTTQAASTAFVTTAVNNAKITVDSALSGTSTNPVQNKVINTALAAKAASSHTHSYLPLAGGTMTGSITRDGLLAQNGVSGSNISINGGTGGMNHGGTLGLYDKNHATDGGCFILRAASDGTNYKDLRGAPDGTLTWDGVSLIPTGTKAGAGYVKLPNGIIIQWGGGGSGVNSETTATVTFPITFPNACLRVIGTTYCSGANAAVDGWVQIKSYSAASFVWFAQFNGDTAHIACDYIAIGY